MAHKAKPKKKPNPETNTNSTKKSNQKTRPKPETKTNPKTEANGEGNKDVASYSFTEPVVRVRNGTSAEVSGPHKKKLQPSQDVDTKTPVVVYYKREKNSQGIDIIGARLLNVWKEWSGRSKSWTNCRRLKLTPGDLELLVQSKNSPVSFGWRFSSIITPSSFARSHGIRANQPSKTRTKRSSNVPMSKVLDEEYGPNRPLPRGGPFKGRQRLQNVEYQGGKSYLRLTISQGTVSMTQEAFLSVISLPMPQTLSNGNKQSSTTTVPEELVVVNLLRNESHADVYLVRSSSSPSKAYHAHAFLSDGLSGNWSTFSRRKMERLRKSKGFRGETAKDGRKILVMEDTSKADEGFRVKNMQQEFPLLPRTEPKTAKVRPKKMRVSYAAVVGRKQPPKQPANSNHRAYRAWEDRHEKAKRMETKMSQQKVEDFTAWFRQVKVQNIPLRNRFHVLSKPIM